MSTAVQGRVRRTIRFAQIEAQAGAAAWETSARRERMNVPGRLEMPSFQHTQDWTGGMETSPSGRFRVIEEPRQKQRPFSREGVRTDWARALIWMLAAFLSVALLVSLAAVGSSAINIQKLETRITAAESRSRDLNRQLAASSGDISVCTRAVELNLISSGGAPTIQLTAPAAATMTIVNTSAVQENQTAQTTEEPEMRAAAGSGQ